jgi:hypothetical protein
MCFVIAWGFYSWGDQACEFRVCYSNSLERSFIHEENYRTEYLVAQQPMTKLLLCEVVIWLQNSDILNVEEIQTEVVHGSARNCLGVPMWLAILGMPAVGMVCTISGMSSTIEQWVVVVFFRTFFLGQHQCVWYFGTRCWTLAYQALYDQEIAVDNLRPLLVCYNNNGHTNTFSAYSSSENAVVETNLFGTLKKKQKWS